MELSSDLIRHGPLKPPVSLALSMEEIVGVEQFLLELAAQDRIVGGLAILALTVLPAGVHLLTGEPPGPLPQVVGRMKSKTAGRLLWNQSRQGQKHIWSSGFWHSELGEDRLAADVGSYLRNLKPNDGLI